MEDKFTHTCIKCSVQYEDNDVDAYLCEKCINVKKMIASEIDRKYDTKGQVASSGFQIYEALRKQNGSNFVRAGDLGIKLSQ
jgi:hypothetical protein